MNGYFSKSGHPLFKISVYGYSPDWSIPVEAMLDTGFTGFLSLPLVYCLKAGLVLVSTADYVLADGSINSTLLCLGTIVLDNGEKVIGTISISFKGKEALLGMEFLIKYKGKLEIDTQAQKIKITKIISTIPTTAKALNEEKK